jgi:hypothetical protein
MEEMDLCSPISEKKKRILRTTTSRASVLSFNFLGPVLRQYIQIFGGWGDSGRARSFFRQVWPIHNDSWVPGLENSITAFGVIVAGSS